MARFSIGGTTRCWVVALLLGAVPLLCHGQVDDDAKLSAEEKAEKKRQAAEEARIKRRADAKTLREKCAKNITLELLFPGGNPASINDANALKFRFVIKITNHNDVPVVMAPFFDLEIRNQVDEVIEPIKRVVRWQKPAPSIPKTVRKDKKPSRRGGDDATRAKKEAEPPPDPLDTVRFLLIEPGATREISCSLHDYAFGTHALLAWRLPEAGSYTFSVTHAFEQEDFRKQVTKAGTKKDLEEENTDWNRALEPRLKVQAKLVLE